MFIIEKSKPSIRLITTVSEINSVTSGSVLEMFNRSTNVTTLFDLPDDSSQYPERYNEFIFDSSIFNGLDNGIYRYTIKDSNGTKTETGLIKVIDELKTDDEMINDNYVFIAPNEVDDDYIVYNG